MTLLSGDSLVTLPTLPADSIESCVSDPPYGLEFMSVAWDTFKDGRKGGERTPNTWGDHGSKEHPRNAMQAAHVRRKKSVAFEEFSYAWACEVFRVLKPGGYLLAFGGTRTYHRLTCAIEDAGFEVRDCLMWLYSQGFPKGKGCLKPGWEPIVLARKPAPAPWLNIDGCRLGGESLKSRKAGFSDSPVLGSGKEGFIYQSDPAGRWPANVVLDEDAAAQLDLQTGTLISGANPTRRSSDKFRTAYGDFTGQTECTPIRGAESGGASRFFATFPSEDSCVAVSTAGMSSSPSSPAAAFAPSDAAISALPEGTSSSDLTAPSTNGTPNVSGLLPENATPTTRCTDPKCSHESPRISITQTIRASDAVQLGLTDITTTTGSRSISGTCVGPAISSTTPNGSEPGAAVLPIETEGTLRFRYCAKASPSERGAFNDHPTVKPLTLMRWLVRLVTPPGGTVIDPFCGSGTTLLAARREGFGAIGIDSDPHAIEITRRRLADEAGPLFAEAVS